MGTSSSWVTGFRSLLAPAQADCLTCGNRGPSSQLPGICRRCAAGIPWIQSPRCIKCGRHVGCPDCTRGSDPSPIICNRSAVAYTSNMREWLGQYKYRGHEKYAPLLGFMLGRAYLALQAEQGKGARKLSFSQGIRALENSFLQKKIAALRTSWEADLLVPVPVSASRLAERGFNQAERLAEELARCRGIPLLPLLIRTHHTGKQSFKGRAARLADMKHAFAADPEMINILSEWLNSREYPVQPLRVIIIDDIYTTGSTIRACAEVIRHITEACGYPSEIYSLTWARS